VRERPYRVYLRGSPLTFSILFAVICVASLFVVTFFITTDQARIAIVCPMLLLLLSAYFVRKGSLSWIRISPDGKEMTRVPSWFARHLLGERASVTKLVPDSEVILCRRLAYGGLDGYYMIVRAPDGAEQVVWNDVTGVSRRWWARIANEIKERYRLNVRLVSQVVSDQGMVESEWSAETDRANWRLVRMMIGPALSPWLGVGVRFVTSSPRTIALAGAVLWLASVATFLYVYRAQNVSKKETPALAIFAWSVQFVVFYSVAVLVTGGIMHR
jgi:hypothetical protein